MVRWPAVLAVVSCLLSGCLSSSQPDPSELGPAGTPEVAEGAPEATHSTTPVVSVLLQGVVVARAPGTGPIPGEGDEASFCFTVPPGSTRIEGALSWFPEQEQMGLEFRYKGRHHTSWEDGNIQKPSPIVLAVEDPDAAEWYAYAGPGIAGGGVAWQLNLTVTGSPGSTPWDGVIEPEGSRFDPANDGCTDW